jgi:hypothetical protein
MRKYLILIIIIFSTSSFAGGLEEQLTWNYQCTTAKDRCWLEKLVTYSTSKGDKTGGVAVAYDNKNQKPMFITVWAIKGLPIKSEILIRFLDSVQENREWKLKPADDGFISIPIMECDKESCTAKVYPEIKTSADSRLNLFEELKKRRFMWVGFKLDGKEYSYMVPVSGINKALEEIKK